MEERNIVQFEINPFCAYGAAGDGEIYIADSCKMEREELVGKGSLSRIEFMKVQIRGEWREMTESEHAEFAVLRELHASWEGEILRAQNQAKGLDATYARMTNPQEDANPLWKGFLQFKVGAETVTFHNGTAYIKYNPEIGCGEYIGYYESTTAPTQEIAEKKLAAYYENCE